MQRLESAMARMPGRCLKNDWHTQKGSSLNQQPSWSLTRQPIVKKQKVVELKYHAVDMTALAYCVHL